MAPPRVSTIAWTAAAAGLCVLSACITRSSAVLTDDYAPVYTRSDTVETFAPGVISNGDAFSSTFTPDGGTVYFTRASNDRSQMQIMRSRWTGRGWSAPVRARFSTGTQQMDPHIAPGGKTLYFSAPRRRAAATTEPDGDWDTWSVRLDTEADAERMTSLVNSAENEMYASSTYDDALFFGYKPRNAPASAPTEIHYWYPKLRSTPAVVPTGADVSSASNPYITANGRVLIISGTGKASRGRADLFVLVRGPDGRWSAPRNLGGEVNTDDNEFCPQLTHDGRYLFFSRIMWDGDRMIGNNIFVVPVTSVPVLRDALRER